MKKATEKILFVFVLLACMSFLTQLRAPATVLKNKVDSFDKNDRVLIIAPHPDDEAIGCAGVIQQAGKAGANVRVLYLTNGDCNQLAFMVYEKRLTFRKGEFIHMGQVRRAEATAAMAIMGLPKEDLVFLGYPDFGTFTIFRDYWQTKRPFKALLTRAKSVPYKENLTYDAPYTGDSILADFKKVLRDYKPNKIFVSHPSDVNGDHEAAYLFLQVALADLEKELQPPQVYPYLIHYVRWPSPRRYHPELALNPPEQLSHSDIEWVRLKLSAEQIQKKRQAVLAYRSQTESSASYLLSFVRSNELFGDFDGIDIIKESPAEKKVSYFGFSRFFREEHDNDSYLPEEELQEGHGQVSFALVDRNLFIRMQNSKEVRRYLSFQVYLFGYSRKVPFAMMPKIRILIRHDKFRIFSGRTPIKLEGVILARGADGIVLKLPLGPLGEPDFILTSIKAYGNAFAFDTTGFRRLNIK